MAGVGVMQGYFEVQGMVGVWCTAQPAPKRKADEVRAGRTGVWTEQLQDRVRLHCRQPNERHGPSNARLGRSSDDSLPYTSTSTPLLWHQKAKESA